MRKYVFTIMTFLIIVSLACNFPTAQKITSVPSTPKFTPTQPQTKQSPQPTHFELTKAPPTPTPPPGVRGRPFALYPNIVVDIPNQFTGGYSLPLDLTQVQGMSNVTLSPQQQAVLSLNGFVVAVPAPGRFREFYQVYESLRYDFDQPIFATTDAVFHVYHLVFDKMLRDLERDNLIPAIKSLTRTMVDQTLQQYQSLKGSALEDAAQRNLAYFCVAAKLLDLEIKIPPVVTDLVNAEVKLINQHTGFTISPIWDRPDLPEDKKLIEDYSQYVPRGHYTRSNELKRYFKTMMWYGRFSFRLRDDGETQRALLITQALRAANTDEGLPAAMVWENIYDPTTFIVGKADDLSYHEFSVLSDLTFGIEVDPILFTDPSLLKQFQESVMNLPAPEVNSMWVWIWEDKKEATQSFRFMGQRFTLDAYIFGQLIWRNVGSPGDERWLPKGLDFFAALGSEEALSILNSLGETKYDNYSSQMEKVKKEVATLENDSWTQNLYWSWLFAFQPIIELKDNKYPPFMQTKAWAHKDLNTALGSWTELKHDTILYAKQVMAEMGGGAPEEPPHGYIEPNPQAYARMLALAQMTREGLSGRGLLSDRTTQNLDELINLLIFMKDTSERELAGKTLSNDDYWRIQHFGGELENLTLNSTDCEGDTAYCVDISDMRSYLVVDVATGLQVLEEATGQPAQIYVILPDQPWRVAIGAVYTYYEFTVDVGGRLDDESWWALVESGSTPPLPEWTSSFIIP